MSGIMLAAVGNSYGALPINTDAPSLSGTEAVGSTLSISTGTWTGAPAPSFTYQWRRNGPPISGETGTSYALVTADGGNFIYCTVTATNSLGAVAADSAASGTIQAPPLNSAVPTISGTVSIGQSLSSSTGTWLGVPTPSYAYQWQRGSTNISGATSSSYTIVGSDIGNTLKCVVTATNSLGTDSASSSNTITVPSVVGQQAYTSVGSFTWVAPTGVSQVSAVCIGGGGGGGSYTAGGGAGLGWSNNISVVAGNSYTVVVADEGSGNNSSVFSVVGKGAYGGPYGGTQNRGHYTGDGGGLGGYGTTYGGGGAGGYSGSGGASGAAGSGGAASGGGGGVPNGGGGVGILGEGSSGASPGSYGAGNGGSGGANGGGANNSYGGLYGGGSGATYDGSSGDGGHGAVRIIWGSGRAYPSTNTADA